MRLWQRNASITIGNIKATGLRIVFDIEKTDLGREANKASISIYNLNESNQVASQSKDTLITLKIGYGDNLDQLFVGNMNKSVTKRQGADMVTTLTTGDGEKALREGRVDKSYAAGYSVKTTIKEVADTFKEAGEVIVGDLTGRLLGVADKKVQTGLTLSGMAKDVMDDLVGKLDIEWSIQDNDFQLLKPDEGTQEEAVLLTPQTGLLGIPVKRGDDGVEFVSLIIPKIRPGRLVTIHSKHIFETMKVTKAVFRGDTHGQPWHITGWAKAIGNA